MTVLVTNLDSSSQEVPTRSQALGQSQALFSWPVYFRTIIYDICVPSEGPEERSFLLVQCEQPFQSPSTQVTGLSENQEGINEELEFLCYFFCKLLSSVCL